MRPKGSCFAFRTLRLHSKAAKSIAGSLDRLPTLEEVAGGVTSLGPAASKPFAKVISEVSCSATMKPRETVLQSTTPVLRLLAPPAARQAEVELSAADHLASGVG